MTFGMSVAPLSGIRGNLVKRILLVTALLVASSVQAATFIVNTTANVTTADPNRCISPTVTCSLRDAVGVANQTAGADNITFGVTGTIYLSDGLGVYESLTVTGPIILDMGGKSVNIFSLDSSVTDQLLTISNVTMRNGADPVLYVVGTNSATINSSVITNISDSGIYFSGKNLIIRDSIIKNNTQTVDWAVGGGIHIQADAVQSVSIEKSVIANNILSGRTSMGGGVYVDAGNAAVSIQNSTINNNKADLSGGGLHIASGHLLLNFDTITGNVATLGGGLTKNSPFNASSATIEIRNSLVAGNLLKNTPGADGPDCYGIVRSGDYNFFKGPVTRCTIEGVTAHNITGQDPFLVASVDLEGFAYAYYPTADPNNPINISQALDKIPMASCTLLDGSLAGDQRGFSRPIYVGAVGSCDIGAVEVGCGNGNQETGETCDDGRSNSNTVPSACRTICKNPKCGDGVVDAGEACDGGKDCRSDCTIASCGDGRLDAGEACDNGAANSNDIADACRKSCVLPSCGDGVKDAVESCDDGNANNNDGCLAGCKAAKCGDGVVQNGVEACDDGNIADGDGCSSACQIEVTAPPVVVEAATTASIQPAEQPAVKVERAETESKVTAPVAPTTASAPAEPAASGGCSLILP